MCENNKNNNSYLTLIGKYKISSPDKTLHI